jgi:hypothetical protein
LVLSLFFCEPVPKIVPHFFGPFSLSVFTSEIQQVLIMWSVIFLKYKKQFMARNVAGQKNNQGGLESN